MTSPFRSTLLPDPESYPWVRGDVLPTSPVVRREPLPSPPPVPRTEKRENPPDRPRAFRNIPDILWMFEGEKTSARDLRVRADRLDRLEKGILRAFPHRRDPRVRNNLIRALRMRREMLGED